MIVDIGANRGQFALFYADRFPSADIISFEPLAEPAACYRRVFDGLNNVRLIEEAIGPVETESQIYIKARRFLFAAAHIQIAKQPVSGDRVVGNCDHPRRNPWRIHRR